VSRRLRIAFARIAQETNALSPVPTTMDDFHAAAFSEGAALLSACAPGGDEAPGFLKSAELTGFVRAAAAARRDFDTDVECVPLFSAWAVPSGPLSRETYDGLSKRLADGLRAAGNLDAVFLCLHGAMGVSGVRDPESRLLEVAREASGGVPLAVTHDLHANITRARIAATDVLAGYLTNPHRDHASTGRRAGSMLIRAALGQVKPTTAWRSLPMMWGGGTTLDFLPPMLPIYARARAYARKDRVLDASVFMCHPWNDDPDLGWSTVVTTDGDRDLAEQLADDLAERCWAVRDAAPPAMPGAAEAIAEARKSRLARKLGVICFSDASDVVSAGATGESTRLLAALLEDASDLVSYVPLRDPAVVEELWGASIGDLVSVSVGGKLDPRRNAPLSVRGRILRTQRMHGFGRMVVLDLGAVKLVLTEQSALALRPAFYEDVGLKMGDADIVVVKNFFPFRLFFLPYARRTIYVRTGGITDPDAAYELTFTDAMHPRDVVADWRPADRRRRGV
jgi:microcystin degradation protein MlrC